jgi:hypothetical protein
MKKIGNQRQLYAFETIYAERRKTTENLAELPPVSYFGVPRTNSDAFLEGETHEIGPRCR